LLLFREPDYKGKRFCNRFSISPVTLSDRHLKGLWSAAFLKEKKALGEH